MENMIYSATWDKSAEMILKSQGSDGKVTMHYIKDGRFFVEAEGGCNKKPPSSDGGPQVVE